MATSMKFEGGKEMAAALRGLGDRVGVNVLAGALAEAAEPMRATMAQLAPREPGKPDIADNMVISRLTSIDGDKLLSTEAAVAIGPAKGFFYGLFLEFGTVKMSARPFVRPAWDRHASGALMAVGQAIWRALASKGIGQSSASAGPVSGGTGGSTL